MRVTVLVLTLTVSGCTGAGWEHTFAYLDAPKPAAPAPAPAAPDPNWCANAAAAAKREAAEQGFDEATQQRRAAVIQAQCQRR
jgi:hypothetical protein